MSHSLIPDTSLEREEIVALQQIRTDMGTQSRLSIDPDAVARYQTAIEKGVTLPPLRAVKDGNGAIILWDGFHRYESYERANVTAIKVLVMPGTQRDAVLLSLSANESHGLPRSQGDRKKAVITMIADPVWAKWKHIDIARACDVDESYVRRLRKEADEAKKPKNPPPASAPAVTVKPTPVAPVASAAQIPPDVIDSFPKPDSPVSDDQVKASLVGTPDDAVLHLQRDPDALARALSDGLAQNNGVEAEVDVSDATAPAPARSPQTASDRARALPLFEALTHHPHGGAKLLKQATAYYFMEDELRDLKRAARATFTHHDSGPFTDAVRALNKIPAPDQWSGCPHCHGTGISPTLGEDCHYCDASGFVFENGVTPGAVAKCAEYDNDAIINGLPDDEPDFANLADSVHFDAADHGPDYASDHVSDTSDHPGAYPYDIADAHAGY